MGRPVLFYSEKNIQDRIISMEDAVDMLNEDIRRYNNQVF